MGSILPKKEFKDQDLNSSEITRQWYKYILDSDTASNPLNPGIYYYRCHDYNNFNCKGVWKVDKTGKMQEYSADFQKGCLHIEHTIPLETHRFYQQEIVPQDTEL